MIHTLFRPRESASTPSDAPEALRAPPEPAAGSAHQSDGACLLTPRFERGEGIWSPDFVEVAPS